MKPEESDKPVPGKGEITRDPLPEGHEGVQFEIGRICKYIEEGRKDGAVITSTQAGFETCS